jgi:hypothetical protein
MNFYKINTLILAFVSMSCFGQNKELDFNLTIYPSSGGYSGYVIEVKESTLIITSKKLKINNMNIVLGETMEKKKRELSKCQVSRITRYLNEMESLQSENMEFKKLYDDWVFDFLINKNQSIKINSYLLATTPELKRVDKFISYLIKLSPIKIKLSEFA